MGVSFSPPVNAPSISGCSLLFLGKVLLLSQREITTLQMCMVKKEWYGMIHFSCCLAETKAHMISLRGKPGNDNKGREGAPT